MWMWCGASVAEPREDGTDQYEQICEALVNEGKYLRDGNRIGYYLLELFKLERDTQIRGSYEKKQNVVDELSQIKTDAYAEMQREATDEKKFRELQLVAKRCEHMIALLKQTKEEQQLLLDNKQPQKKEMWVDL